MSKQLSSLAQHALLIAIAFWISGCSAAPPENLPTPIEGYNHTSAAINRFTVNGGGGPNIGPHQGGGKQNCCVSLPMKWRPGLRAVVEWEKDPDPFASQYWPQPRYSDAWSKAAAEHETHYTHHRAVVELPPYDKVGAVVVHFLPCDQVKVIASIYVYGHPQYAIKEPLNMEEPKTCQNG
ncbi:hypothetical protein H681_05985 [Pseudomonas sp. ATCC 13867]|uniref:DUF3304 domain-containing protein n=1 Tax=Pseudomonas sp. ATCC 13867 TaxID=1294143 RepID=UPI0002C4E00A|nr:DUF3304 domain-containing protein [Pseudomonas sp. ATCC 13867]AGI23077.1 hypothetical protein H681_05985 [Pseudomonas sp. ATCC 13867]